MAEALDYEDFVDIQIVGKREVERFTLAIAEEAGELCGKLKRLYRGDYKEQPFEYLKFEMALELGDILFYVVALAHEMGFTLEDIRNFNIEKLQARNKRGTIMGSGDDR